MMGARAVWVGGPAALNFDDVDVERFGDLQQPTDHHRAQAIAKSGVKTALPVAK